METYLITIFFDSGSPGDALFSRFRLVYECLIDRPVDLSFEQYMVGCLQTLSFLLYLQVALLISTSLISNNSLSRSENLVPVSKMEI